jgi:integrase/recombinase XerD
VLLAETDALQTPFSARGRVRDGPVDCQVREPSRLCDANAVTHNPVKGVKRPKVESYEGKTPALGDGQARALLDAPGSETLKGRRDRAILSVLLYHGLRREELCTLKVRDIHQRRGVLHLRVYGKGGKVRYLPLHPGTAELVTDYLEVAGHGGETAAASSDR